MEMISIELINLLATILTVLSGFVTQQLVSYLKKKSIIAQLDNNRELVKIVVKAVEQAYEHLKGEEKLNMAKMELVSLMNEKNIRISEKEIDLLIEAMVREMNEKASEELSR